VAARKSQVQVTLDTTSIAVLKAILHQAEQVVAKRSRKHQVKDSTGDPIGQLPLLDNEADKKEDQD
jgi:hypothetical protein